MLLPAGADVVPRITLGVRHARMGDMRGTTRSDTACGHGKNSRFMRRDVALYSEEEHHRRLRVSLGARSS